MMSDDKIVSYLEGQVPAYLQLLQKFVELESPSFEHKEASDKCSRFLEETFGGLGFPQDAAAPPGILRRPCVWRTGRRSQGYFVCGAL